MDDYFPSSYAQSREWFFEAVESLRARWKDFQPGRHPLAGHPDLSIDWLWAVPTRKKSLFILSHVSSFIGLGLNLFQALGTSPR